MISRQFFLLLVTAIANCAFTQQRNVVFIIVDDLKPLLGAYDVAQMHTPTIDALARESAIFTNAHTQQAICGPSRISLLTGMRPDYTKVWDLNTYMRDQNPTILTIPEHFKNNGYQTAGMGKVFHMAKKDDPQSWTLPFTDEKNLPFSKETGAPIMKFYQNPEMKKVLSQLEKENDRVVREDLKKANVYPATESLDIPDDAYPDGAMAVKSIELLDKFKADNIPFFLTIGFNKPHLPFVAPKKYWDLYERESIELAPFQQKAEDTKSFVYHKSGELHNYSDIPSNLDVAHLLTEEKQRELIHGYYACISYVDTQIGKVIDHLKKLDLYENTVIVLVGDHGWHLGDHGLWNKHTNFEQATRTPLIVHRAGMLTSITNDSPVELVDVFPTISELANLPVPEGLHGVTLVPILNGERDSVKEIARSQYPRNSLMGYSARSDRYRYTEWHKKGAIMNGVYVEKAIKEIELYDYVEDPLETRNLIDDPRYAEVAKNMKSSLKNSFKK